MLPIETNTLIKSQTASCMINQLIDNEPLCINNNPNSNPMTRNEVHQPVAQCNYETQKVVKSYEIYDGIIQESYFDTNGMEDADDFIDNFASAYPKGIILVVNNASAETPQLFPIQLNSHLKQTIFCSDKTSNSLSAATKKAYSLASSGQAIFIQGVRKDFDLFSHIH